MEDLINNAPCGFLVFSDDGKIVDVNDTLLVLLGYEREELLETHIEKIFSVAGRIFYQTHFFPLLKLKSKVEEIYLDLKSKSGINTPVLVNAVRHERGGELFNDCVFVPMRQRSQYEDELLLAKKEAESALIAKDEFLSVVSHELRTPLSAILGWARMLQDDQLEYAMIQKGLDTIQRNAQIQTQLIEDILDFSRIISGKMRLEVRQLNLAEVIKQAVDVVTPAANARNIRIQTVLDSNDSIFGDPDRLQQVLWNLLTNAIKFTQKGGRVQVRMQRVNSSVEIVVSDTGRGISEEFLPFIFDRFEQQDKTKTRRFGGLGLGLAITYRIVELHGGTIRAESDGKNTGATFTVNLPVTIINRHKDNGFEKSADTESFENSDYKNIEPRTDIRLDSFHVLIVDDEPDARELMQYILTQRGALVTAAASVPEALEKFNSAKPDLIISDIEMPGEDGFSLISKINEINRLQGSEVPAIALTAHAQASERLKTLSAGYRMHLAKPVEPAELLTVVYNFARWKK